MTASSGASACLLISCPDAPGIVATVTGFLYNHGANITALAQYSTDPEAGRFFMRLAFETPHLDLSQAALEASFKAVVADRFAMDWHLTYAGHRKKTAILVSKQNHALLELLWRNKRGELPCELAMVISNHPDHASAVEEFGIPYHHVPVTKDTKPQSEAAIRELMGPNIELVVLARYMQILSPEFVQAYPNRIINIHHSFLPAFIGARPYHQAFARGVKIIGATAHYVTADLDAGPIIDQDVVRVTHRDTPRALISMGRNVERTVLAQAVRWHLEDRILVDGNKTVVFD